MNGKFITVEGVEGAGKSTQIDFLESYLSKRGISVVVTREPGGTVLGEQIRHILLDPKQTEMTAETELLLMFAARSQHLAEVIEPALENGHWVLCDRFIDASYAYQGAGRGIEDQRIEVLADWTLRGVMPDLTLLFDLPVSLGLERVNKRRQQIDRFEQQRLDFFEIIRERYLQMAKSEPQRIKTVDSSLSILEIENQLIELLAPHLQ